MNIFDKATLQGLKKDRIRTLVAIVRVILSAALIATIATFTVFLQTYMVNEAIMKYGSWHATLPGVNTSFIQEQVDDNRVTNIVSFENIGYGTLKGG